jgi:hypothetical protein
MAFARWAFAAAFVLAACGSDDGGTPDSTAAPDASQAPGTSATTGPLTISNEGGSLEGHTPRGFAGSGTGLFAGDSLNPSFPADDGVQIWLTFVVPPGTRAPSRALLSSDELTIDGSPFEDLGPMQAAPVTYDNFGPELFDLSADGPAVDCLLVAESRLECDVTDAAAAAIGGGSERIQFRLRFDRVTDGDGDRDLALFFLTDSNTNEPGIFQLELS